MSYSSLSDKIYTRLSTLEDIPVYQYELQMAQKYPYITIVEDDSDDMEMPFDNITDTVPYNFKVRVIDNSKDIENTTRNSESMKR